MHKTLLPLLLLIAAAAWAQHAAQYRQLPALDLRVFLCAPNPAPTVISSSDDLQHRLAEMAPHCASDQFSAARAALDAGLREAGIDWTRESLVVIGDWYGTGMAKGRLDLVLSEPMTLSARVDWQVPPPPVTPDTAVFFGAFAVDRTRVRTLKISGRDPAVRVFALDP
jgi:hypothetical protein